jgi:hypothetical protein
VATNEHPEGQGERIHPTLPISANREARLFAYWDHEPQMPWQTQEYYDSQKKTLRPGTYLRLHENQWAVSEETFITPEMWDPCVDQSHRPSTTEREPLFVGIDVGIKHDLAARVAVKWDETGEKLILVSHRIWKPTPTEPLDLENTVEEDLRELNDQADIVEYLADPYQFHRSLTTLQAAGLPIQEFNQTTGNCTLMGQTLFDLLNGQNLVLYADDELRQQALSTVSVETPRGWRIAKEKTSKKIDAIVALSMACVSAMAHRAELSSRAARGFNRSMHVANHKLIADRGPLFIGQTFEEPATCVAQFQRGVICVLALFVNEGMSLSRHLETVIRPWIKRFAPGSEILGAYSNDGDVQTQWTNQLLIEKIIGGNWQQAYNSWESRKDSLLDLLGKAVPGAFVPALQIDPTDARLLIDALSGRWSYEKNRRDTRTIWHHFADAFTCAVDRIGPGETTKPKTVRVVTDYNPMHGPR